MARFGRQLLSFGQGGFHIFFGKSSRLCTRLTRDEYELSPKGGHHILALLAHLLRHDSDHVIALQRADESQASASIPARRLDNAIPFFNLSLAFCLLDHWNSDSVFNAPARVIILQFRQNWCFEVFFDSAESDNGSVPDQIQNAVVYFHFSSSFLTSAFEFRNGNSE